MNVAVTVLDCAGYLRRQGYLIDGPTVVPARHSTRSITIKGIVASHFRVSVQDLEGQSRRRRIARPRQVAMFLASGRTHLSLEEIGQRLGGRDHTTVLHGCRQVEKLMREDDAFRAEVLMISAALDQAGVLAS